jgi:hypothetical protein
MAKIILDTSHALDSSNDALHLKILMFITIEESDLDSNLQYWFKNDTIYLSWFISNERDKRRKKLYEELLAGYDGNLWNYKDILCKNYIGFNKIVLPLFRVVLKNERTNNIIIMKQTVWGTPQHYVLATDTSPENPWYGIKAIFE